MRRLVDAVVDAPSEVLHKRAEEAAINGANDEVGINGEMCGYQGFLSGWVVKAGR
jgi:hypothetical protein